MHSKKNIIIVHQILLIVFHSSILFFVLWILEALVIYRNNMLFAVVLLVFAVVLTVGAVSADDSVTCSTVTGNNGSDLSVTCSTVTGNGSSEGNNSLNAAGSTDASDVKTSKPIGTVKGYWIRYETRYLNSVSLATLKSRGFTDIFVLTPTSNLNAIKPFINKFGGTNGLRIHAWIICFQNSAWINPDPNTAAGKKQQVLIRSVVKNLVSNYNIQGIQLDCVRYPGTASKYDARNSTTIIDNFVASIRDIITQSGKSVYLSAAVMPDEVILPNGAGKYYGQNYDEMADYLDFIVPMTYKGNFNTNTKWIGSKISYIKSLAKDKNGNPIPVLAGIQNYKGDGNLQLLSAAELNADAAYAMAKGASGYVVFRYGIAKYVTYKVKVAYKKVKYRAWVKKAYKVKKWVKRHGKWVRKYVTKYKWKRIWKTKWLYTYRTYGKYVLT